MYSPAIRPTTPSTGTQTKASNRASSEECSAGRAPAQSSAAVTGEDRMSASDSLNSSSRAQIPAPGLPPIGPETAAEGPDLLTAVRVILAALPDAHKALHGCPSLLVIVEIPFAHGLTDQFGHRLLLAARASVERSPDLVIQVQLCAPHDVQRTSCRVAPAYARSIHRRPWICFPFSGGYTAPTRSNRISPTSAHAIYSGP